MTEGAAAVRARARGTTRNRAVETRRWFARPPSFTARRTVLWIAWAIVG
jgi:hypothetical protein